MKIECFFSEGCASGELLRANIEAALRMEGLEAEVTYRVVADEEARRLGLPGSPTVWIDGHDLEGLKLLQGGLS